MASTSASNARSSRAARVRLAARVAELELCLTLVRAALARRGTMVSSPTTALATIAAGDAPRGARALLRFARATVAQARARLDDPTAVERAVIRAAGRAITRMAAATSRYLAALGPRTKRSSRRRAQERAALARSILTARAALAIELDGGPSPMWGVSGTLRSSTLRPGVARVRPSDACKSGTRWSTATTACEVQR
jgi:hypothetical protein